jgi:hypothetical protein
LQCLCAEAFSSCGVALFLVRQYTVGNVETSRFWFVQGIDWYQVPFTLRKVSTSGPLAHSLTKSVQHGCCSAYSVAMGRILALPPRPRKFDHPHSGCTAFPGWQHDSGRGAAAYLRSRGGYRLCLPGRIHSVAGTRAQVGEKFSGTIHRRRKRGGPDIDGTMGHVSEVRTVGTLGSCATHASRLVEVAVLLAFRP